MVLLKKTNVTKNCDDTTRNNLGALLLWQVFQTWRKKLPPVQEVAQLVSCPIKDEVTAMECQSTQTVVQPVSSSSSPVKPVVVSSEEQWDQLWPSLQKELSLFPVLGLDCEWVSVNGRSSAVSLLQIASYSGLCVLVRLVSFRGGQQSFPLSLTEVLRDPHILKVGVGCYEDGKRLTRDYGLSLGSTVDLRYLALRQRPVTLNNSLSLQSLAADVLNVSLDKSLKLRCSDWEADQLTLEQITYAARDAQVSISLFFHLLGLDSEASSPTTTGRTYPQLAARCQGLVNVPFRHQMVLDREETTSDGDGSRRLRKNTCDSPESGDKQVPDPRKNPRSRRKPLGVGYHPRRSPVFDNCFLQEKDGQLLSTCSKRKAMWYLSKEIGELQSEDPLVVRLLFEPSGRLDCDFFLMARGNHCVVCGKADSCVAKHVVPTEYQRHFPFFGSSHDILPLCTACLAASSIHDGMLRQQLAEEYDAPLEGRILVDQNLRRVRYAARTLLNPKNSLPENRREELEAVVKRFYGDFESEGEGVQSEKSLSPEALQMASDLEPRTVCEAYVPHGLNVVRGVSAEKGPQGLMELERRWRKHFLTTMKPRHMPPLWSVDHFRRRKKKNMKT